MWREVFICLCFLFMFLDVCPVLCLLGCFVKPAGAACGCVRVRTVETPEREKAAAAAVGDSRSAALSVSGRPARPAGWSVWKRRAGGGQSPAVVGCHTRWCCKAE